MARRSRSASFKSLTIIASLGEELGLIFSYYFACSGSSVFSFFLTVQEGIWYPLGLTNTLPFSADMLSWKLPYLSEVLAPNTNNTSPFLIVSPHNSSPQKLIYSSRLFTSEIYGFKGSASEIVSYILPLISSFNFGPSVLLWLTVMDSRLTSSVEQKPQTSTVKVEFPARISSIDDKFRAISGTVLS